MPRLIRRITIGLYLLAVISTSTVFGQEEQAHISIDADAAILKAAFNKDIGTTRVVVILSPT